MIYKFVYTFFSCLILLNIYIASISTFIAFIVFTILAVDINYYELLFVFFGTSAAYSFQRLLKFYKNILPDYLSSLIPIKIFFIYTLALSITSIVLLFFITIETIYILSIPFILTVLYLFIHPKHNKLTGLRYVPFLKTFIVSATWIILPMLFVIEKHNENIFYLLFAALYIQIWQSCLLFDWRDKKVDLGQIKTIVLYLSKKGFILLWIFISLVVLAIGIFSGNNLSYSLPLILICYAMQWIAITEEEKPILQTVLADGSLVFAALSDFYLFTLC